jgi:nucleotidyltransferase substrate binding protein (TIGR01987 family)
MIQRFEYCCDTLWKLLRDHLKKVELVTLDIIGPKSTFRALCNAKFITEADAKAAISMIESRNMTSHTYKEEYADTIARSMPEYLKLMQKLVALLKQ